MWGKCDGIVSQVRDVAISSSKAFAFLSPSSKYESALAFSSGELDSDQEEAARNGRNFEFRKTFLWSYE